MNKTFWDCSPASCECDFSFQSLFLLWKMIHNWCLPCSQSFFLMALRRLSNLVYLFILFFKRMMTKKKKKLCCTRCLTHCTAAGKVVPASGTKRLIVLAKATQTHTHSQSYYGLNQIMMPVCCRLPVPAQHKLLTELYNEQLYHNCVDALQLFEVPKQWKGKWTWETGRLRRSEEGRCWVAA